MKNIELFNSIAGLVLAKLYENFPIPMELESSQFALALSDEMWSESTRKISDTQEHYEIVRGRSPAFLARPTIEWLATSGFISYRRYSDGTFHDVVLTEKGLISIQATLGEEGKLLLFAKDVLSSTAKEMAIEGLQKTASNIFSWAVQNIPVILRQIDGISQ